MRFGVPRINLRTNKTIQLESHLRFLSTDIKSDFDHVQYSKNANERIAYLCNVGDRTSKVILSRVDNHPTVQYISRQPGRDRTVVYCIDDVADAKDCALLCNMLKDSDMQTFMMSPGERKISGDTNVLENVLNDRAVWIVDSLKRKMQNTVEASVNNGKPLYESGSIISWLSPPYAINTGSHVRNRNNNTFDISKRFMDFFFFKRDKDRDTGSIYSANSSSKIEPLQQTLPVDVIAPAEGTYSYWSAHCDKANNNDYDLSALLYLNNDFSGGDLIFMDSDRQTNLESTSCENRAATQESVIQPKRGRLVVFNSCVENIHRVQAVTEGNRFLLSVWYSFQR